VPILRRMAAPYLRAADLSSLALSFVLAVLMGGAVASAQNIAGRDSNTPTNNNLVGSNPASVSAPSVSVTVVADGDEFEIDSTAPTVGDLLAQQNITLGKNDRCSFKLSAPLAPGMRVRVVRVRTETAVERTPIPFAVKRKYTPSLKAGEKKVVQPGAPGERADTYIHTFKDTARVRRVKVSSTTTKPKTRYEMVGVRGMSLASRGAFPGRRIVNMVATGYGPSGNGKWGMQTATGRRPGYGVVAVDPRFIRLGTRLYIEGYGSAVAGDTGGAIKGARIDLGFATDREAAQVGRRRVRVMILD